jgi:branched-chain amino acid transport system ATP-binding protein
MALAVADTGYILENGRVVKEGPAEQLREDADIREFYLGISSGEGGQRRSFRDVKSYRRRKAWTV